jgi:multicomponent Na+:H+ antiporter subunit E
MMKLEARGRIVVFVLAFLVWMALTMGGIQEVAAGIVVAAVVSLTAGKFLFAPVAPAKRGLFRRILSAFLYFFVFLWEMMKANIHVASIVLHPLCPIRPGIVKIRTCLTRDAAITVLGNSITLTPGTFTIDVNPEKKELYIHCIEVRSTDIDANTEAIGGKFEPLLTEVFE